MISRAIPFLAALLLAAPALAVPPRHARPATAAPLTADGLMREARAATQRGDTELALRLAQSAIVQDPSRPAAYVALGDVYAAMGQAEFARSYYDAALAIEPTDAGARKAVAALDDHAATTANARP